MSDPYLEHAEIEHGHLGYYVFSKPANLPQRYLHSDGRWLNGPWGRTTGFYLSEAAATAALAAARERAKVQADVAQIFKDVPSYHASPQAMVEAVKPEPAPAIQLRVGGAYRTTDGSKVEIYASESDYAFPVRGRIVAAGSDARSIVGTHLEWCADGRFWQNDERPQNHRWGIVAEWSEPEADVTQLVGGPFPIPALTSAIRVEQLERELEQMRAVAEKWQRLADEHCDLIFRMYHAAGAINSGNELDAVRLLRQRAETAEQALSACQVERDRLQVTLDRSRQVANELAQRPVKELTARAQAAEQALSAYLALGYKPAPPAMTPEEVDDNPGKPLLDERDELRKERDEPINKGTKHMKVKLHGGPLDGCELDTETELFAILIDFDGAPPVLYECDQEGWDDPGSVGNYAPDVRWLSANCDEKDVSEFCHEFVLPREVRPAANQKEQG